jgi:membrane protease YdiL (CAAX protease family)
MGYLYMRSVSILPATIFHFFANTVFLGFSH